VESVQPITPPGSDLNSYKLHYRGQYFLPLSTDYILRLHTRMGYGGAYGSTSKLPFYENFQYEAEEYSQCSTVRNTALDSAACKS
jgi:outer membrane protein assembly factor BamA